jgi:hypothetical protein
LLKPVRLRSKKSYNKSKRKIPDILPYLSRSLQIHITLCGGPVVCSYKCKEACKLEEKKIDDDDNVKAIQINIKKNTNIYKREGD